MFTNKQPLFLNLAVIGLAVILLVTALLGASSGKSTAEAHVIVSNAESLAKAFDYFYSDQDRYPTALEFSPDSQAKLMLNYLSNFPRTDIAGKTCPQNFIYKRTSLNSYQFDFCLPTPADGFKAGWNEVTEKK